MIPKNRKKIDILSILGLSTKVRVGAYDWERKRPQTILLDLHFTLDTTEAIQTDFINATVNYNDVAKRILSFLKTREFKLIETLADKVAELCLTTYPILSMKVTVHKPNAVRSAEDVTVTIERT